MSEKEELRQELGYYDSPTVVNHDLALDTVVDRVCAERDRGKRRAMLEFAKQNSPPNGLGLCTIRGNKMINSWWLEHMEREIK